jgi:hypothetical protein
LGGFDVGCRDQYADYGLEVDTWCGLDRDNRGEPQEIGKLDDRTNAYHFVYISNLKTYDREIHVRGFIDSPNNRARFEGQTPPVVSETEWKENKTISGQSGTDNWTFKETALKKKMAVLVGQEDVKTSVEYEDQWTIGKNALKSSPLVFRIETTG